ncbi:hypothetical protein HY251_17550 [bacterium]|nr:hypothetical protein [bacterium]
MRIQNSLRARRAGPLLLAVLALTGAASLVAGCGLNSQSSSGSGFAPPDLRVVQTSGEGQTGAPGQPLPLPLVVTVEDTAKAPQRGVAVTFAAATGGGALTGTVAVTDSSGQAWTTLTLGSKAGANTVVASVGSRSVTFTATAKDAKAASLFVNGLPSKIIVGTPGTLVVTARDASGDQDAGYRGTIAFTSSDPRAVLPANYTFTEADAGAHTFTVTLWSLGDWWITATDTADKTLTGTLASVKVTPGPATHFVLSGLPSPYSAGARSDLRVAAVDANGYVDSEFLGTVSFSTTDMGAGVVLPASYAFTMSDMGAHKLPLAVVLETPGPESVTATQVGNSALTGTITVTVAPTLRVTSFTAAAARVAIKGTDALSWTVSGAPTKLTLSPGSIDETGKTGDTPPAPFPSCPSSLDPRKGYRLTAANAAFPEEAVELTQASSAGGASDDAALGCASFADGSAVMVGSFKGTATFGGTVLVSSGGKDAFVARYKADGTLAWAIQAGGSGDDAALGVAALDDGSCLVVGYHSGGAVFDATTTLVSSGGKDAFVARYDSKGGVVWAQGIGGAADDVANAVVAQGEGTFSVAGSFSGSVKLGPSATLVSAGGTDAFVARFHESGTLIWARAAGGTGDDAAFGLAALGDGGTIAVGSFLGSATFGATTLTSAGGADAFFARYGIDGSVTWAKQIGGTLDDGALSAAAFPDGTFAVAGFFRGTATFAPGKTLASSGDSDAFLARYDASGALLFSAKIGGAGADRALGMAPFADGSVVVTGAFSGAATAGAKALTSSGAGDGFLARFDAGGALLWALPVGGASDDAVVGAATFEDGSFVAAGTFSGTATLGPGASLDSSGGADAFLARWSPVDYAMLAVRPASFGVGAASAYAGGTSRSSTTMDVASLPDGGTISVGTYYAKAAATMTFGTYVLPSTAGYREQFLVRHTSDGKVVWANASTSTSNDVSASGLATFLDGSSITTGYISGAATFGSFTLSGTGVYVARYSAAGACTKATLYTVTTVYNTGSVHALSACTFIDGSYAIAGSFTGTATFGGSVSLTVSGSPQTFVARFKADDTADWAHSGGTGSSNCYAYAIASFADGACVLVGNFILKASFDGTDLSDASFSFSYNQFVVKYVKDGTVAWAKGTVNASTTGASHMYTYGVATCADGSVVTCGHLENEVTFGFGESNETPLKSFSSTVYNPFVCKLGPDGALAWAKIAISGNDATGQSVAAFPDGSLAFTGDFKGGTLDFGGPTLSTKSVTVYVARYSTDGTVPSANNGTLLLRASLGLGLLERGERAVELLLESAQLVLARHSERPVEGVLRRVEDRAGPLPRLERSGFERGARFLRDRHDVFVRELAVLLELPELGFEDGAGRLRGAQGCEQDVVDHAGPSTRVLSSAARFLKDLLRGIAEQGAGEPAGARRSVAASRQAASVRRPRPGACRPASGARSGSCRSPSCKPRLARRGLP